MIICNIIYPILSKLWKLTPLIFVKASIYKLIIFIFVVTKNLIKIFKNQFTKKCQKYYISYLSPPKFWKILSLGLRQRIICHYNKDTYYSLMLSEYFQLQKLIIINAIDALKSAENKLILFILNIINF